jgi:hypothetical protein
MQKLLNWRQNTPVIHHGKLRHFAPQNGVYVYFRYNEKNKVMVVLNKNEGDQRLDLERFSEILEPDARAKDVVSGEWHTLNRHLSVPAKTPLILEIE